MSMPSFPPCGADMTKDEALTMIIASIAMEELALSHIINAEGEKLQYILGTLPGGPKVCAGPQEVLAVNKSVTELLNTVMQNQMLLKGKLEKALEAGGHRPGPGPEPPGPCGPCRPSEPPDPCGPPPPCGPCKPSCPCEPPCGGMRGRKSMIRLDSHCNGFTWDDGYLLSWRCRDKRGGSIRWNEENPALVELEPEKAYALDYTINVRGPYCGDSAGAVFVRLTPCDAFSEILPLYFSTKCLDCEPMTLHYSTVLFPQAHPGPCANLALLLNYGGSLFVEQAALSIFEL